MCVSVRRRTGTGGVSRGKLAGLTVAMPGSQYYGGDARASSMEGNAILDLRGNFLCANPGETTFLTAWNELIDGYKALDEYLMGLRKGDEVGEFWYIDEPTQLISGRSFEGPGRPT
jgi:hypothetical protein